MTSELQLTGSLQSKTIQELLSFQYAHQNPLIPMSPIYMSMTESKKDEQLSAEEMEKKISGNLLLENTFHKPLNAEAPVTPGFKIDHPSHKTTGLQSASDMWIDKDRLFEGLSRDEKDIEKLRKMSGL